MKDRDGGQHELIELLRICAWFLRKIIKFRILRNGSSG